MPVPLTKEFQELIKKYLDGKTSDEEIRLIENYYHHFADEPEIISQLTQSQIDDLDAQLRLRISARIKQLESPVVPLYRKWYMQVAAALLILFVSSIFYIHNHSNQFAANQTNKPDFAPGGNKAVLTLANGSKISLNSAKNGNIAQQGQTAITKTAEGQIIYAGSKSENTTRKSEIQYNTITIPKAGQYQLVLADGTKVWLNAASSLTYPTAFTGKERTVVLTGEAYFEVAKNKYKPFNVKTATQTVQVLGTHFNINAYDNETAVKTTLLEGSVKVSSDKNIVIIKPGQQAIATTNNKFSVVDADTDEVMAWKNEMFQFNGADIQTIMRQIARWYDVDVSFQGKISNDLYRGKISRNVKVSQVLKILALGGANFTIEGRTIIVK